MYDKQALREMIPSYMVGGMERWIEYGIDPGDFLTAVLTNNLKEAFAKADETNRVWLENYVRFLCNHAPAGCWGSQERYDKWRSHCGLKGL